MTDSPFARVALFYVLLMIFTCSPIWSVDYFINQDGSGHLHSAYLMSELLKGNESLSQVYQLNSISVPNSSGHWILMLLIQVFSSFTVTKIMVTLTFALFVLATGWLRFRTVGIDGVRTSLMIGAAIGFNWLWLVGFYNFIIGVIVLLFTLGVFVRWREKLGFPETLALAALLTVAYLSHIVSFLVLAGSVLILASFVNRSDRVRSMTLTCTAMLPVVPLILMFKQLSASGGGFSPVWRTLQDPYSITSWVHQIRVVDPFIIISRKAFPFFAETSNWFAVFTPSIWLFIAFSAMAAASFLYYKSNREDLLSVFPFAVLSVGALLLGTVGPDDFQHSNGGCLRERFLICGMLFFVPLFRSDRSSILKKAAQCCLAFVIVFQTLAVWDYALDSNRQAGEFLSGAGELRTSPSSILVTIGEPTVRFHATTIPQLNCYNGIGNDNIIWDNYEFGHYLFPVITKSEHDRRFIHDLTTSEFFSVDPLNGSFEERYERLAMSLRANHHRIETAALWGSDPRVEALLAGWFESEPYFRNGRLRLFRHR